MKLIKAKSEAAVDLGNVAFVDHIEELAYNHNREKFRWNS
jgi:hypothetical protein